MWQTRITDQLGIELPFVGAGMAIVGGPELTAAVSNAGGFGQFCLGPGAPDMLGAAIDQIRQYSDQPFGVDFIVEETAFGPATTEDHISVAIEREVPLCLFFWNPPPETWVDRLRTAGIKVWGTAYSVESARRLEALGADAVIVQTSEAGGHVRASLGAMALLPAVADAIPDTPVIAAGGIVDGRTAAAAFVLGADAVCVGTRLVASVESLASDAYKQHLLAAEPDETTVTTLFGPEWPDAPMRVITNRAVQRHEAGEAAPDGPIGNTTVFGQAYPMPPASAILPTVATEGDHEEMCLAAGAGVAGVRSVSPAGEIVAGIMADARRILDGVARRT